MDEVVFTALYALHAEPLGRHAAQIVRDPEAGADIAHDTLLKALVREPGPPEGWLYRVAHNAAVDHLRRASHSTPEEPAAIERRRDEANPLLEWGDCEAVHAAIDALPCGQREVVILRYCGQLSPAEAAAELGKSAAAVRQLELRALAALHARLEA
jgi:RNA polymerase sigma-70 factor (ECF subfamily)